MTVGDYVIIGSALVLISVIICAIRKAWKTDTYDVTGLKDLEDE